MNVDDDSQASQYQMDLGSPRPEEVLLTEWAGVHLDEFPPGTVTAHYESALRYQATAPAFQAHLQERYSWSPQTMAAVINWKAHGSAFRRHLKRRGVWCVVQYACMCGVINGWRLAFGPEWGMGYQYKPYTETKKSNQEIICLKSCSVQIDAEYSNAQP